MAIDLIGELLGLIFDLLEPLQGFVETDAPTSRADPGTPLPAARIARSTPGRAPRSQEGAGRRARRRRLPNRRAV